MLAVEGEVGALAKPLGEFSQLRIADAAARETQLVHMAVGEDDVRDFLAAGFVIEANHFVLGVLQSAVALRA